MAIKVNGTTVINDSRSLQNIASVDATTVAALSAAGVGDITNVSTGGGLTGGGSSGSITVSHADTSGQGSVNNSGTTVIQDITLDTYGHITSIGSTTISASPPTTAGAVGTYIIGRPKNNTFYFKGNTASGLWSVGQWLTVNDVAHYSSPAVDFVNAYGESVSGTWRCMTTATFNGSYGYLGLWIRIS